MNRKLKLVNRKAKKPVDFARIFNLPKTQVVMLVQYDPQTDGYDLVTMFNVRELRMSASVPHTAATPEMAEQAALQALKFTTHSEIKDLYDRAEYEVNVKQNAEAVKLEAVKKDDA